MKKIKKTKLEKFINDESVLNNIKHILNQADTIRLTSMQDSGSTYFIIGYMENSTKVLMSIEGSRIKIALKLLKQYAKKIGVGVK